MRSRFSAFAVSNAGYLLATWHPSTRPESMELSAEVEWLQLEIRGIDAGGEGDAAGTVEFVALYWDLPDHERGQLHEHSRFVREDGQWYYVGPA